MRKVTFWFCVLTIMVMVGYYIQVDSSSGTTLGRIAAIPTLISWFLYKLETRRVRGWAPVMYSLGVFFMYGLASLMWSMDTDATAYGCTRIAVNFVLVIVIWDIGITQKEARGLMQAFIGAFYIGFFTLLKNFASANAMYSDRFAAEGIDVNETAFAVILAMPIAWWLGLSKTPMNGFLRFINLAYPAMAMATLLLTASRSGLLDTVPVLIYITATSKRAPKWVPYSLMTGAVGLGVAVLFGAFQRQIMRFGTLFQSLFTQGANGRLDTVMAAYSNFKKRPLFGSGLNTDETMSLSYPMEHRAGLGTATHNLYAQTLETLGLVGFVLYMAVFYLLFAGVKRVPKDMRAPLYISLVVFVIGNLSVPFTIKVINWIYIGVIGSFIAAYTAPQQASERPVNAPAMPLAA